MTEAKTAELRAIRETFVRPFYLELLGGGITTKADGFCEALVRAARGITNKQIETLLTEREWRGRLTVAWLVGLDKRVHFVPQIGKLLLASELVYAGMGYCLALGLIGGDECTFHLRAYLDTYLPLNGRVYNQDWAIGALTHLQGNPPAKYLEASLWRDGNYSMDPARGIEKVANVIAYLRSHEMICPD